MPQTVRPLRRKRRLSRERLGMALAIVAVACLSSVIVQWSAHFPGQENVIEHPLFGDLTEDDDVSSGETTPLQQTASLMDGRPQTDPGQAASEHKVVVSVELSGIEPVELIHDDSLLRVSHARFTEPSHPLSTSIRKVSSSDEQGTDWLSGVIAEGRLDNKQPTSRPGRVVQLGTIIPDE